MVVVQESENNPAEINKKIEIVSSFACQSCGRGSETYSDVFADGACKACGAPVEKFDATVTEIGLDSLNKSILVISADDLENEVDSMLATLKANQINTFKASDFIVGVGGKRAIQNLEFIAQNAAWVFIVPSAKLESNPIVDALLNALIMSDQQRTKANVVPIYMTNDSYNSLNIYFKSIMGCDWNDVKSTRWAVSRERLLKGLKENLVRDNQTEN